MIIIMVINIQIIQITWLHILCRKKKLKYCYQAKIYSNHTFNYLFYNSIQNDLHCLHRYLYLTTGISCTKNSRPFFLQKTSNRIFHAFLLYENFTEPFKKT